MTTRRPQFHVDVRDGAFLVGAAPGLAETEGFRNPVRRAAGVLVGEHRNHALGEELGHRLAYAGYFPRVRRTKPPLWEGDHIIDR